MPIEIARAHLEAVAYRFAAVRDILGTVAPGGKLLGTGAALVKSATWAQILADVLREEIAISLESQASARGAALWVRENTNLGAIDAAPPLEIVLTLQPNPQTFDAYAAGRARHDRMVERWFARG